MIWFWVASLSLPGLILLGSLWGGVWTFVALAYVSVFTILVDRWRDGELPVLENAREQAERLSVALVAAHFVVLPVGVWAVASDGGLVGRIALGIALGAFVGQVSHPNAHELIHSPSRRLHALGVAVYTSMLFGHHASAHPKVHHVLVATPEDPNSPRPGEGFYRFWPRAWVGSFLAGLRVENRDRARRRDTPPLWQHPYVIYCGGAVAALGLAISAGAGIAFLLVVGYAQMQLLLADYVQHYGLSRRRRADGRWEPVGPQHSWNTPHWYSSSMMLNAPRHSDHHVNPSRSFPSLRLDRETMPTLPWPMPLAAALAMMPHLWRRLMDPRAARWRCDSDKQGADLAK